MYQSPVTDQAPLPVAFRLKRPYNTEEEFLLGDGHAVWRSGMILVGANPRPIGLIVRFEVALQDGTALFRGEGKVIAHRPEPDGDTPPGLEVQFIRLDARGKTLLERLLARRSNSTPPPPDSPSSDHQHLDEMAPVSERGVSIPHASPTPPPVGVTPHTIHVEAANAAAKKTKSDRPPESAVPRSFIPPPPDRELLLNRLRERHKANAQYPHATDEELSMLRVRAG